MTQRIEPCVKKRFKEFNLFLFSTQRFKLFFSKYDSKNWTFFSKMTQNFELTFRNMSQRIEYDSNDWFFGKNLSNYGTFFYVSKNWALLKIWLKNFFFSKTWLKELNLVSKKDSKKISFYMTRRLELFFWCDSKNWTLFLSRLTELNFFLRKIWLTELNPSF